MKRPNNSSNILQDFVGDLLTEVESDDLTERKPQKKIFSPPTPIQKPTLVKELKLAPKPLLSERLHRAQTLLQAMPEVEEVIESLPETPVKEATLPEVLATENLLAELDAIPEDEIVILDEETLIEQAELEENLQLLESSDEIIIQSENAQQEETVKEVSQLASPLKDGVPEWGKGSFQTLIFNIGELKLALPLIKLGGIHRLEPELTKMPENPPWFLGLIADELGSIAIIDTALWIMPEKYEIAKAKGLDYEFFVLLDDTRWGLACSNVDNAITLSEDDVRWNAKNSKRPWLAGMLVDEMCALLDVKTLIHMLDGNAPSTT